MLDAIERGTFDYSVTFPNSPRAVLFSHEPGAAMTLSKYLDRWLIDIRPSLKASTFTIYKRIFVQRALTQHSKEPETPKTAAGERYVKLLPPAQEALKAQKASTFMEGEEIFQNPNTDKRWTGDMVIRERMWKRVLLRAGVRYRYPYQMRHTYASMMLQVGESVMWVAHSRWAIPTGPSRPAPTAAGSPSMRRRPGAWRLGSGAEKSGPKNEPNPPPKWSLIKR
ncbi:site-specific integrase [Methylohalobius crimeensis]|uniref:hypothetical protein n=1 Tax=Methylohalobius crimeensis TaxID=244365 RepID=UPI000687F6DF|nr:hypothetical protein [Methylohalobius crimeensis]